MAQAKKKTATKTAKKGQCTRKACAAKKQPQLQSNMFFVISMSMLAATLLFADLFMMVA